MLGSFQNSPRASPRTRTTCFGAGGEITPWRNFAVNGAGTHVAGLMLSGGVTLLSSIRVDLGDTSVTHLFAFHAA